VISDSSVTRLAAQEHREKYHVHFPVLFDTSGELRKQLQATHTPHAFVLGPGISVVYDGCIDDRYPKLGRKKIKAGRLYLKDAVTAALTGQKVDVRKTKPVGCLLEDRASGEQLGAVTYARDIAPMIHANCIGCHRPGESAPFPLLNFDDVSAHAGQICAVTSSRLMPPWKAAKNFGHFRDERRLSENEIALLRKWVDAGKPRGDSRDLPTTPNFPNGWQLGEPDLVLTMSQEFEIPASGDDHYQHFVLPSGLHNNRLISAVEFRPGNPRVVHHASFFFDTSGSARKLDQITPEYGYHSFGGPGFLSSGGLRSWIPGQTPRFLPKGTGRFMPKKCDIVIQIHYQSTGKPERDRSRVGLHFASYKDRRPVAELQVFNGDLDIPPGASQHHHYGSYTVPKDVVLLDVAPHMHLLGREIKSTATLPDGSVIPLVWIKNWDFYWQGQYTYRQPIRLPKGSRIDVESVFDNSANNPLNPSSPPIRVHWGEQTKDEMGLCHFQFTTDNFRDFLAVNKDQERYLKEQHSKRSR